MRMHRKDKEETTSRMETVSETTDLFLPLEEPTEIELPCAPGYLELPCAPDYFQPLPPPLFLESPTPSEQAWRLKVAADLGFPLDLTPCA